MAWLVVNKNHPLNIPCYLKIAMEHGHLLLIDLLAIFGHVDFHIAILIYQRVRAGIMGIEVGKLVIVWDLIELI